MIIANQITKVIAPLTNAWLDFGTNDMMLPVSPPEMNVKSAGMIVSQLDFDAVGDSKSRKGNAKNKSGNPESVRYKN